MIVGKVIDITTTTTYKPVNIKYKKISFKTRSKFVFWIKKYKKKKKKISNSYERNWQDKEDEEKKRKVAR